MRVTVRCLRPSSNHEAAKNKQVRLVRGRWVKSSHPFLFPVDMPDALAHVASCHEVHEVKPV